MIEQWLLNVNNCEQQLLTTVVDRVQHNIVEQCAAQDCNKLLTTLIKLFILARVVAYERRICVDFAHGQKPEYSEKKRSTMGTFSRETPTVF